MKEHQWCWLLLAAFLFSGQGFAAGLCPQAQGMAAEEAVDAMKSWPSIYAGFKRFSGCDDGGVAEGFTEAVVHLLSSDWPSVKDAADLSSKDERFRIFLLKHIDASADTDELKTINRLSQTNCPSNLTRFCARIHIAAKKAVAESAQ